MVEDFIEFSKTHHDRDVVWSFCPHVSAEEISSSITESPLKTRVGFFGDCLTSEGVLPESPQDRKQRNCRFESHHGKSQGGGRGGRGGRTWPEQAGF